MCYPLNGSDLTPEHNPIEAGLGFFVDLTKKILSAAKNCSGVKENGLARRLVAFKMKGKGPPPRPHYPVWRNGEKIGEVTSGTLSPSLNQGIGMAYRADGASPKIGERSGDRNSRAKISCCHRKETTLQKIMRTFPTIFVTLNRTNGSARKATRAASASPIMRRRS